MKTSIKKWGNSAAVRIPAAVLEASLVRVDEEVDVREDGGRIIIEPVREKNYKLSDLVKGMNRKNVHGSLDFGSPEGKEIW
jgi:antitoxin MazE